MRCVPGDIARVVPGHRCAEFMRDTFVTVLGPLIPDVSGFGPGWLCEGRLGVPLCIRELETGEHLASDMQRVQLPDAWLRPIRGEPGRDETLEWAHVPHDADHLHPRPQREFAR